MLPTCPPVDNTLPVLYFFLGSLPKDLFSGLANLKEVKFYKCEGLTGKFTLFTRVCQSTTKILTCFYFRRAP